MGSFSGAQTTVCRACGEDVPVGKPRYKLARLEHGGRGQGSGVLVGHLCERCGKASEKGWDKNRALVGEG